MSNINDYLLWRGDLPLNENFKFNSIDDLILARFSYLIFNRIKMEEIETIESISEKMKNFLNEEFRYNGDKDLISNLGNSIRFKNMKVTDFVANTNKAVEEQFSGITIHISDEEIYVSFIGTDATIVGWKEDFNMTFMDTIPAQKKGQEYLEEIAKKYPKCNIRIGGHSKGGNVAIYSAINAPTEIQNRIISVCNYDGPGFNKEVIESVKNKEIINKIHTFIPQDSVIGRLLEHKEKCTVVHSIEKGIYQHDIFSWQVIKNDFEKIDEVTKGSEIINQTVTNWLKQTTPEQRQIFIDGVFDVFYSTDADKFREISESLTKNVPKLFKAYKEIPEEDRKIMTSMLKEFGKAYKNTLFSSNPLTNAKK